MLKLLKLTLLVVIFNFNTLSASDYETGKEYYYNKNYAMAIYYFKKAKEEYSNMNMQILWALSEEALNRNLYLIAAYERILNLNPNNFTVAMKLNNLYNKRELKSQLMNTIDNFNFDEYKTSYRPYLTKFLFYDKFQLRKLHSNYSASIQSDDLQFIYEENNSTYEQQIVDEFATRVYYTLKAEYSYIYDLYPNGLFFKADAKIYTNMKNTSNSINMLSTTAGAEIGKKFSNIIITLPLSYNYNEISDHYIYNTYSVSPKAIILLDESHIFNLSLLYSKTSYLDENMYVLDHNSYGLSSSMRYILPNNNMDISVSYLRSDPINNTVKDHPYSFIKKNIYDMYLSTIFPIQGLKFKFFADYKIIDYKDEFYSSQKIYEKRKDELFDISTTFYTNPTKDVKLLYKINYLYNDTNYKPLNYDKLIFSIGLEFNS